MHHERKTVVSSFFKDKQRIVRASFKLQLLDWRILHSKITAAKAHSLRRSHKLFPEPIGSLQADRIIEIYIVAEQVSLFKRLQIWLAFQETNKTSVTNIA